MWVLANQPGDSLLCMSSMWDRKGELTQISGRYVSSFGRMTFSLGSLISFFLLAVFLLWTAPLEVWNEVTPLYRDVHAAYHHSFVVVVFNNPSFHSWCEDMLTVYCICSYSRIMQRRRYFLPKGKTSKGFERNYIWWSRKKQLLCIDSLPLWGSRLLVSTYNKIHGRSTQGVVWWGREPRQTCW